MSVSSTIWVKEPQCDLFRICLGRADLPCVVLSVVPVMLAPPPPADASMDDATRALARSSHRLSAAAGDARHPAGFSHLRVLQPTLTPAGSPDSVGSALAGGARGPYVLSSTPPRPSDRKPSWAQHLADLATKPGEKCGRAGLFSPPTTQSKHGFRDDSECFRCVPGIGAHPTGKGTVSVPPVSGRSMKFHGKGGEA